jgi:hypothetical protein
VPEAWAPSLSDVAKHIPSRTRDTRTPGSDKQLGTFTSATTPTQEQAQSAIDDAVAGVLGAVGALPMSPPASDQIAVAARSAAEWRAAADIELAYPNRDADVRVAAVLDQRAKDALATLIKALASGAESGPDTLPVWQSPPVFDRPFGGPFGGPSAIAWWGDTNL